MIYPVRMAVANRRPNIMMFTHEQLLKAVRKAGRNGQPFTCAGVRDCLGLSTRDKKQLNRFYSEFRTFQKAAPEVFEKVGKNAYRLTPISELPEPLPQALVDEPEQELQEMVCVEIEIEPEPAAADSGAVAEPVAGREPAELGFAESAHELESLELPLQLIEVDFDLDQPETAQASETQRVEELIRRDAPQPALRGGWLSRGQWLGRRVAEFFLRS
jgi:hypothetical protein